MATSIRPIPHILLANADDTARQALLQVLRQQGFEHITAVENGLAAAHVLNTEVVHLLITDILLGQLDGWRLTRILRSGVLRSRASIPVIVVSSTYSEHIAEITAKEYGVNRFLPFVEYQRLPTVVTQLFANEAQQPLQATLLVIEDNEDTAYLIERVLQHRFQIELSFDGETGLQAWLERRHDLVLLDLMLPYKSGDEVLASIMATRPQQPVIIMTAHSSAEQALNLMLAGAVDFLPKPFRAEQLRQVCEIASRHEDYMLTNAQFKQRLQQLETAQAAAAQAEQSKSAFLTNMSHEMLTPLNGILGTVQLLQWDDTPGKPPRLQKALQDIEQAGEHLHALLKRLLELASLQAGDLHFQTQSVLIDEWIAEVAMPLYQYAIAHNNVLDVHCAADLGTIDTDKEKASRILAELLENACKFTQNGYIVLEVESVQESQNRWLQCKVTDNGIGISADTQSHLFDALFSQQDNSSSRRYGGTGTGLVYAHGLCQRLGGQLQVESEEGIGSTFILRLPFRTM